MTDDTHDVEDHDPYANLYYRCIRFKNGDLIIAGVPKDDLAFTCRTHIEVYTPVQLVEVTYVDEEGNPSQAYTMRQWMPMSDEDYFEIPTDAILTICQLKPQHEEKYFTVLDRLHVESLKEILALEKGLTDDEREEIEEQIEMTGTYVPSEDDSEDDIKPKYLH